MEDKNNYLIIAIALLIVAFVGVTIFLFTSDKSSFAPKIGQEEKIEPFEVIEGVLQKIEVTDKGPVFKVKGYPVYDKANCCFGEENDCQEEQSIIFSISINDDTDIFKRYERRLYNLEEDREEIDSWYKEEVEGVKDILKISKGQLLLIIPKEETDQKSFLADEIISIYSNIIEGEVKDIKNDKIYLDREIKGSNYKIEVASGYEVVLTSQTSALAIECQEFDCVKKEVNFSDNSMKVLGYFLNHRVRIFTDDFISNNQIPQSEFILIY